MDRSPILKGAVVVGFYAALIVILVLFLIKRAVPRRQLFQIVQGTVVVFVISFLVTLQVADRITSNGADSLAVNFPPLVPTVIFVVWSLRKVKRE
jgi:hypothetical protein